MAVKAMGRREALALGAAALAVAACSGRKPTGTADPVTIVNTAGNFAAHLAHSSALGAAEIPPPRSTYHRHRYYKHYWHSYW